MGILELKNTILFFFFKSLSGVDRGKVQLLLGYININHANKEHREEIYIKNRTSRKC